MIVIIATVAILIFINGLYVAAEFATVASRRTRINQMAGQDNRMAKLLLPIVEDAHALDNYVAACQIGITLSSLVLGAYGQNVLATLIAEPLANVAIWLEPALTRLGWETTAVSGAASESLAAILVLAGITLLQVILGELFPKSIAIQYPENVALTTVIPMKWTLALLKPIIIFFNGSGRLALRALGRDPDTHGQVHTPEEIEILVTESHESGLLEENERQMLRNAFRLRDLTARQVMVHRTKLLTTAIDTPIAEIIGSAIEEGYSRIPIFRDSIDEIIGFVHIKDLFRLHVQGRDDIQTILREVLYVPEMLPVVDVWQKLNTRRKYLAVVFDEYGGTAGMITFEDLIEEIFGELQDEFDNEMALIARDKDGRVYLRGDLLITDVNEYLNLSLPTDSADTLSGLIFSALGRPPVNADEVKIGETLIRVEGMEDLGVSEVSLLLPSSDNELGDNFSEWEVAEHE